MFNFWKNWFKQDQDTMRSLDELKADIQEEAVVEAVKVQAPGDEAQASAEEKVRTELSLHPAWEAQLDAEKKYTLRFLQAELPEMVPDTIGVTGFSLIPSDEGVTVALFFRNGTNRPIRLAQVALSLLLDGRVFARHEFDLSELGEIPPLSSRPWEVTFPKESFRADNIAFDRWKVAIHLGKRVRIWPKTLDLDPEMEYRMTERQVQGLERLVRQLPPLDQGSVETVGFDIGRRKDGKLVIAVLFRNAQTEPFTPKKLTFRVLDKAGDLVAEGTVDASAVRVLPGTSRPWLIVFPPSAVKKPDADLSKWQLQVTE